MFPDDALHTLACLSNGQVPGTIRPYHAMKIEIETEEITIVLR